MKKRFQVLMKKSNELSPEIIETVDNREEAEYVISEHLCDPVLSKNDFHILEVFVYDSSFKNS